MTLPGDLFRRVWGIFTGRPHTFWPVQDDFLAGSSRPTRQAELQWLKKKGFQAVLSLCEKPLPEAWAQTLDLVYRHIRVANHRAPEVEQLEEALSFIDKMKGEGRRVVVHCSAGKGRTGTVIAAYLIKRHNLSLEEALKRVRERRPGAVEPQQEEALRRFLMGQPSFSP